MPDLNTIWFILLGVLLTGYAILDGFDLGVGALHLWTRGDEERRLMLNSIGPLWDGNEVWLVTGGGAMFAAFPDVYATVFSGFYTAFMLLMVMLIFRAVSIEFRSKFESPRWRQFWDVAFSVSSVLIAILMGVSLGNIIQGIPLGADKEFQGGLLTLLNPYALLVGATTVTLFTMHGAIYAYMKTEGALQQRLQGLIRPAMIAFILMYTVTTLATLIYQKHMIVRFESQPLWFLLAVLNVISIANIPREVSRGKPFYAFLSSVFTIATLMAFVGVGLFPNLVFSHPNSEWSLTIYNAASSQKTLGIMFNIALLGMPFVLTYTATIYWIFRGKVKLDAMSY